jgi:hypothetical protein
LDDGPALAPETARRLSCDASLVRVVEGHRETLSVGRKTRAIPPAVRRALQARDRGCRFPGCTNRRFVDAHHIRHWAQGGETKMGNLLLLCRSHHRLVHEGGFAVELFGDGSAHFRDSRGSPITDVPRPYPGSHDRLIERNRAAGAMIDRLTCASGDGDRMDLSVVVAGLAQIAGRAPPE